MLLRLATVFTGMVMLASTAFAAELRVTATFLPVWIFTKNITAERAEVSLLVPPGTEVHEYTLRPQDAGRLWEADLVIMNGAGLERFLNIPADDKRLVDTSRGIDVIREGAAADPHIWLDPLNAVTQVANIRDALVRVDPENRTFYEKTAGEYMGRLRALHSELEEGIGGLSAHYLITFHSAFQYFARRYGLIAYSLTGVDAEQPLPGRMKAVYDIVESKRVPAVFAEEGVPRAALARLREDLGVEICSLKTLGSGLPDPAYYEEAMRENLAEIRRCLGVAR